MREQITQNATLSQGYLLMNVLAAVIASCGLLANSPSVVIGAMIEDGLPAAPHGLQSALRIRFVHTTVLDRNGLVYRDAYQGGPPWS